MKFLRRFVFILSLGWMLHPYPSPLSEDLQANKSLAQTQWQNYSQTEIAQLLNWVPNPQVCNLCEGYYQEPELLIEHRTPLPAKQLPTQITSEGPGIFVQKGWSQLQKNVVVTQPGRILMADRAYIYRDNTTNKITRIVLVGNVRLEEFGKLLITALAVWDLEKNTLLFHHILYHVLEPTLSNVGLKRKMQYDAWGKAEQSYRNEANVLDLWHASYSTCSPIHPFWNLQAGHMRLNKATGRGVARNVVLKIKKVPILYTPYLSFPIDDRRKSGFLGITYSHGTENGLDISAPYYWNMAPNYDDTITPRYMSKRGVMINNLFRYLTPFHLGTLMTSFLPDDKEFDNFRETNINHSLPSRNYIPYVNALKTMSNNRGYLSMSDTGDYNNNWHTFLAINYVSDPYYFRDFGTHFNLINTNQLLNEFEVQYNGTHWDLAALAQGYQTLHQIDHLNEAENQYTRFPEFDFNGSYPDLIGGLDLTLNGQAVNFTYRSDFPPFTYQMPLGQRFHFRPSLSDTFNWSYGYFTPLLAIDETGYDAQLGTKKPLLPRPTFTSSRVLPIFNIDSGLFFDRRFAMFHNEYTQTLEPRVFYLYVPYSNQNNFPVFDTQLLPFSIEHLFSLNRFTGFDRLQNANQVSFALTSRVLAPDITEKLDATAGFIYYFDNPRVTTLQNSSPTLPVHRVNTSPVVGRLTYYPWTHWSVTASGAYELNKKRMQNGNLSVSYSADTYHILNLGYNFVRDLNGTNNTELLNTGLSWRLTEKWSALAYWYYNLQKTRPESYYGGLEYSTCCWAVRFIGSKNLISSTITPANKTANQYRTAYYVQFMLKGLGNFGNNDPSDFLTHTLPGFVDPFKS